MAADLHHELAGDGPAVVLLHPGIADSRIWDPQWTRYADRFRVLRLDLPGFDLDGAVEADLRMWVDGPRRGPGEVDPTIRAKVATMQHDAYVLTSGFETWSEEPLVSDLPARLHEVAAPTLVILGELDVGVIREQAEAFAATIPGARLEMLPGTAHVPSLERSEAFDALVLPFLDEHASAARPTA
jgi:pimeloyl-ACP methyl ester carboxylesterase